MLKKKARAQCASTERTPLAPNSVLLPFKIKLFAYRHFDGTLPEYLSDSLCAYQTSRMWSSSEKLLKVTRCNIKTISELSFIFVAPTVWNCLPATLRNLLNLPEFKLQLKINLFRKSFPQCWIGHPSVCVYMCVLQWVNYKNYLLSELLIIIIISLQCCAIHFFCPCISFSIHLIFWEYLITSVFLCIAFWLWAVCDTLVALVGLLWFMFIQFRNNLVENCLLRSVGLVSYYGDGLYIYSGEGLFVQNSVLIFQFYLYSDHHYFDFVFFAHILNAQCYQKVSVKVILNDQILSHSSTKKNTVWLYIMIAVLVLLNNDSRISLVC